MKLGEIIFTYTGNAGGYLGLFLGYALLNVPELLNAAYKWTREKCISALRRSTSSN